MLRDMEVSGLNSTDVFLDSYSMRR